MADSLEGWDRVRRELLNVEDREPMDVDDALDLEVLSDCRSRGLVGRDHNRDHILTAAGREHIELNTVAIDLADRENHQACSGCPMRKDSAPGWLGAATPEGFMSAVMGDAAMPCHQTIDYEDREWREKWRKMKAGSHCVGVANFFANILKVSRDPNRPRAPKSDQVFENPAQFVAYHSLGPSDLIDDDPLNDGLVDRFDEDFYAGMEEE